jgi:tetratricopeptide (TPR) repeat protein
VELDQLPSEYSSHPEVLKLRFHIERMRKRFPEALALAEGLIASAPDDKWGWLYRSHALHWLGRSYELPYDLACYCAQTGRVDEARTWLTQAFQLGDNPSAIRSMALDDADLKPLWEDIRSGSFGKT